jgi:hypothetical protein
MPEGAAGDPDQRREIFVVVRFEIAFYDTGQSEHSNDLMEKPAKAVGPASPVSGAASLARSTNGSAVGADELEGCT